MPAFPTDPIMGSLDAWIVDTRATWWRAVCELLYTNDPVDSPRKAQTFNALEFFVQGPVGDVFPQVATWFGYQQDLGFEIEDLPSPEAVAEMLSTPEGVREAVRRIADPIRAVEGRYDPIEDHPFGVAAAVTAGPSGVEDNADVLVTAVRDAWSFRRIGDETRFSISLLAGALSVAGDTPDEVLASALDIGTAAAAMIRPDHTAYIAATPSRIRWGHFFSDETDSPPDDGDEWFTVNDALRLDGPLAWRCCIIASVVDLASQSAATVSSGTFDVELAIEYVTDLLRLHPWFADVETRPALPVYEPPVI